MKQLHGKGGRLLIKISILLGCTRSQKIDLDFGYVKKVMHGKIVEVFLVVILNGLGFITKSSLDLT